VAIDVPEMWSGPATYEGLLLRVLYCIEGGFVGTCIEGSVVGEDGVAAVPADCCVESQVVIPKVKVAWKCQWDQGPCVLSYGYGNVQSH